MIDRPITHLAKWLSKPVGFLATCLIIAVGLGLGAALSWDDRWAAVFNLFLSIAALLIAAIILVAGAKDTGSIHAKLDELLRAVAEADDRLIGIDQRSMEELEAVRTTAGALEVVTDPSTPGPASRRQPASCGIRCPAGDREKAR